MSENKKMLPCPFCGGKAIFVIDEHGSRGDVVDTYFHIECEDCEVETPKRFRITPKLNENGEIIMDMDGRVEAIEMWNKRTCGCKKQEG